jgi:exonuclease VII large subunit
MNAVMEARAEARQEKMKADINANITASQDKVDAKIEARLERMEATVPSMRCYLEQSLQKQVEDVLSDVDHKTHSLQLNLTEKIESAQVKLDTIELALEEETNNLRSDLSNMQAETIPNRLSTSDRIEAVRREVHTRLEEAKKMAGHTRGTRNGTCAVTQPKFDGTTSWSFFGTNSRP